MVQLEGGRAGGQAGRRAGGQAGRRAGGQAGRRAGGQAYIGTGLFSPAILDPTQHTC